MRRLIPLLLLAAAVAACSKNAPEQPAPTSSPVPLATVAATPQPLASATPTALPGQTAAPVASATPTAPAATPLPYNYVYTAPPATNSPAPGAPQIIEIDMNERVLAAPGPIRVRILTSTDVTSVIARTLGRELGVPQQGPGIFGADDQIPNIPFFLRNRTYNVEIVAAVPDGRTTSVTMPITLR